MSTRVVIKQTHRATVEQTNEYILSHEEYAELEKLPEYEREQFILDWGIETGDETTDVIDLGETFDIEVIL